MRMKDIKVGGEYAVAAGTGRYDRNNAVLVQVVEKGVEFRRARWGNAVQKNGVVVELLEGEEAPYWIKRGAGTDRIVVPSRNFLIPAAEERERRAARLARAEADQCEKARAEAVVEALGVGCCVKARWGPGYAVQMFVEEGEAIVAAVEEILATANYDESLASAVARRRPEGDEEMGEDE